MSKVTSKYQVTLPRRIARAHHIGPGTEIEFESAGDTIRIHLEKPLRPDGAARELALRGFDEATRRVEERRARVLQRIEGSGADNERGWTREELYADRIKGPGRS